MRGSRNPEKRGAFYNLYFVRPRAGASAEGLAEELINLREVQEVFLTEETEGYQVKTRFFKDQEPGNVTAYITKHLDGRYGKAVARK